MKLFLKILAGVIAFFVVLIIGLNLYLTNERLQEIVMPRLNEMAGREITVESIDYTLFRTFPRFGLVINGLDVPDTDIDERSERRATVDGEPVYPSLASLEQLIVNVDLIPLFSGRVNVNRLEINRLDFNYVIYEDERTNLDSLLAFMSEQEDPEEADPETATELNLSSVKLIDSRISYQDRSTGNSFFFTGMNASTSLSYTDVIVSDLDLKIDALRAIIDGELLIDGLPLSLVQRSVFDMDTELLTIEEGRLNIRGLDLNLEGSVSEWSEPAFMMDLKFQSSSDDFAALLEMLPESYREDLAGVETRGSLVFEGEVVGRLGEDVIPDFDLIIGVNDGFLRYPDVQSAIEDIQLSMTVNNSRAEIERFSAIADGNTFSASGNILNLLEDDATFTMNANLDLDLATVKNFYPLEPGTELRGKMVMTAEANGRLAETENARFDADISLTEGYLKYPDVDEPVEDIAMVINATQDLVRITSFEAKAAANEITLNGTVSHPLDETRTRFDLRSRIKMDLATIPKFYPIDEDTLSMRGNLDFDGRAQGLVADVENATITGRLVLSNGAITYHEFPAPLQEVSMDARITDNAINLSSARIRTGNNNFSSTGEITNYLSDSPSVNLTLIGNLDFKEIFTWFPNEAVTSISGTANSNVRIRGPVTEFEQLRFNGNFVVSDFNVAADSLPQPIENLNANLVFNNNDVELRSFTMQMGSSDFDFSGNLRNYMRLVDENSTELAELTARFKSQKLMVDELWEYEPADLDAPKEEFPIELPKLRAVLDAEIDSLVIIGIPIINIKGNIQTTDKKVSVTNAEAGLFSGRASGSLTWDVPQPDRTKISFSGNLRDVRAEDFFRETNFAGFQGSDEYLSGIFNSELTYETEMDIFLDPIIETTVSEGNFGLRRARFRGHPTQNRAADLLRVEQLRDLSLDTFMALFKIRDGVMTINELNLTSRGIGVEMQGTQNLITEALNYRATVVIPGNLASNLEPVITRAGVDALKRSDGNVPVPVAIRGTTEDPRVTLDQSAIEKAVERYLREQGEGAIRDRLRNLFGN